MFLLNSLGFKNMAYHLEFMHNDFDNNTHIKFNLVIMPCMAPKLCPCLIQPEAWRHACSMDTFFNLL